MHRVKELWISDHVKFVEVKQLQSSLDLFLMHFCDRFPDQFSPTEQYPVAEVDGLSVVIFAILPALQGNAKSSSSSELFKEVITCFDIFPLMAPPRPGLHPS